VDGRPDLLEEDYRRSQIALAAYYRAERRGFRWPTMSWTIGSRLNAKSTAAWMPLALFGVSPRIPDASDTHRDLIENRTASRAWARKLKVSTPRLREAIERVGPSLTVVKQYLENSSG
jgi:hypothetical protein